MPADVPPPYVVDYRLEAACDRRDRSVFHSAPDSLHLRADVYGEGGYRFPPVPVTPGVKYRLSFHYLTASNGFAAASVRLAQYRAGAWTSMEGGTRSWELPALPRWKYAAIDFVALPGATSVELDFRLQYDAPVGECWVDDCSIRPCGSPITVGP